MGNQEKNVFCFDQSAFSNFALYVILKGDKFPQVIIFPLYNEQDLSSGEGAERYWWPRKVKSHT